MNPSKDPWLMSVLITVRCLAPTDSGNFEKKGLEWVVTYWADCDAASGGNFNLKAGFNPCFAKFNSGLHCYVYFLKPMAIMKIVGPASYGIN